MPRISGIDIPPKKKVKISLRYIYGIGPTNAMDILKEANIDPEKRADAGFKAGWSMVRDGLIDREHYFGTINCDGLNAKGEPIRGLYAVGTDGCQLYRETYTMNIPASCQGNNVNSGRVAAREICAEL